jgi:hypothetical protein
LLKSWGRLIIEVPDYNTILAKDKSSFGRAGIVPDILHFSKKGFVNFSPDKWSIVKHTRYGTLDAFTLWWLGKI